ncbi:MAG: class I fructose-bisphosphate aldolase [Anaerolineales bacterium]|jgi:DhnA family fructose-bisphosphate aldolase class Ia
MSAAGEQIRLSRLFNGAEKAVVVAVDHGLYFGPLPGLIDLPSVIGNLSHADGILLSAGMVSHCVDFFQKRNAPSMIVRLNWATNYVASLNYKHSHSVPLLSASEAVGLGADLAIASLTLRTPDEAEDARNVELFASYVQQKTAVGIPLICEVYPIGGDHAKPEDLQDIVALGCRMAAELGADLIKTFYTGKGFSQIAAATPIPIFALGALKKPTEKDALIAAADAVSNGARGVVFGRNVVQAKNPEKLLDALNEVVKSGAAPDTAAAKFDIS